jgi:ABC-2 type transport system permease protein
VLAALAAILLFASLGVIVGIYAQTWDHNAFVQNLVIQPLAFLGGVFYSVQILPSPWQELTHANPLFYTVDGIRYGFLGTSDVAPALAIGVTIALASALFAWSVWLFRSGHKLKP